MSRDTLVDDYPLRVKGKKAQRVSGDVCMLYDITVALKIKISYIIGLDWQRKKRVGETSRKPKVETRNIHIYTARGRTIKYIAS